MCFNSGKFKLNPSVCFVQTPSISLFSFVCFICLLHESSMKVKFLSKWGKKCQWCYWTISEWLNIAFTTIRGIILCSVHGESVVTISIVREILVLCWKLMFCCKNGKSMYERKLFGYSLPKKRWIHLPTGLSSFQNESSNV